MTAQNNPRALEIPWKTDLKEPLVPLEEFTALMVPDGIPPIDAPRFLEVDAGRTTYFAHEPVIAIAIGGEAKAYPLSILMYHEIVNDRIGGVPVCVTYCPLCNAAIVFDRRFEHRGESLLLDFGVSGMLRKSDMVMYDRQTESWWQQFTGDCLVGTLKGGELSMLPSQLIGMETFFMTYPSGRVLSPDTGKDFQYGSNPYVSYDDPSNTKPRLFKGEVDERLPAMERVIDIQVAGKAKIYPLTLVQEEGVINDVFQKQPVVLFHLDGMVSVMDAKDIRQSRSTGSVTVFDPVVDGKRLTFAKSKGHFKDQETDSTWDITGRCTQGTLNGQQLRPMVHGNHFAFAWFAFMPECEIHSVPGR